MRIIALFLLCLAATATANNTAGEAQIAQLLDRFLAGASINDAAMHDRFWAEDLVYTSSAGQRFGKARIMQGLSDSSDANDDDPVPQYSAREVNIRVFDNTAVLTFRLVATEPGGGESHYFNTGVFRHADDQWRAIAWQATHAND